MSRWLENFVYGVLHRKNGTIAEQYNSELIKSVHLSIFGSVWWPRRTLRCRGTLPLRNALWRHALRQHKLCTVLMCYYNTTGTDWSILFGDYTNSHIIWWHDNDKHWCPIITSSSVKLLMLSKPCSHYCCCLLLLVATACYCCCRLLLLNSYSCLLLLMLANANSWNQQTSKLQWHLAVG